MNITDSLGAWIPQVQGKYINMDGAFGAQCWDLSAHWAKWTGLPVINTGGNGRWPGWAGNMVDAFPQSDAIAAAYTLHGPGEKGQPGDHVIWGDSYWYYPATHVAVLIADKGAMLTCMSQNSTPSQADNPYPGASSGPTTIQSLPRQGLIGFIRPRMGGVTPQGTITPQASEEDDMSEALDKVNLLHQKLDGNHLITQQKLDGNHLTTQQKLDNNHLIIQRRLDTFAAEIAGLRGALAAATTNPGITPESLTAAFKDAVGEYELALIKKEG